MPFCIPLPGMPMFMLARLNPRGVPVACTWLPMGKWPLLLASLRDGAMCAGSTTYAFTSRSYHLLVFWFADVLEQEYLHPSQASPAIPDDASPRACARSAGP